ncbi:MAG: EFR1 family ferrodoxin, partial [Deltaproteobacteria bacterium]
MKSTFKDLGISAPILNALEGMGFETPTEVQSKAIPFALEKKDLIVISKTGSGKTAVFGVPLLQLIDSAGPGPQALILTPTRELAVQVDSDLKKMAMGLPHKTTAVYGQHSISNEIEELKKGVAIVTGTPGRVFDHIGQKTLITKHIHYLVLDEVDRMLDMGFIDQVWKIIKTLPRDRVTLLFSATIPDEVQKLCRKNMKNPVTVELESDTKTVDTIKQFYYRVKDNEKNTRLNNLLQIERPESCMIFANTRFMVDKIQVFLSRHGYDIRALHGDIPQDKRLKTLQQFKRGEFKLLVATDVAARGIHIDDLSLVVNYDVPLENDGYVHRIGRTGRAGNGGRAVSLVTGDDIMSLYEIENHIGVMIEETEFPLEDYFKDNRATIEEWAQSVSIKKKPRIAAVASNTPSKIKEVEKAASSAKEQPSKAIRQKISIEKPVEAVTKKQPQEKVKPVDTTIFYMTGTGNSLWASRVLAQDLGNTEIISMYKWKENRGEIKSKAIGLIFPVHIWGVPRQVLEFIEDLQDMNPEYIFAIANNAGQVSNTLVQLRKVMESKGMHLSAGWSVLFPSNYIPWGGPGPAEEQNKRFREARIKLSAIASRIRERKEMPVEKGPLWQRIVFTWLYDLTFNMVPKMDEKFWVDDRCNKCGLCVKLCPVNNVTIEDDKIIWNHRCEQCLACLQWCPQECVQYGNKTPRYERYHHPEIKAK